MSRCEKVRGKSWEKARGQRAKIKGASVILMSALLKCSFLYSSNVLIFSAYRPDLTLGGLDCLLEASRQILLEAIEKQSHIDLPRTLDPNKKYSWRQRKEEPVRGIKISWSTRDENLSVCEML